MSRASIRKVEWNRYKVNGVDNPRDKGLSSTCLHLVNFVARKEITFGSGCQITRAQVAGAPSVGDCLKSKQEYRIHRGIHHEQAPLAVQAACR